MAPKESGRLDYVGGFAVTTGHGVEELAAAFRARHDDYSAIMAQALGDRLAEALAELMHKRARELCGFGLQEDLSNEQLIGEQYRGIRPAPGYPACPEHTEKRTLFALLGATEATGITLTESCAMSPASSVSGFYFNHPEARYFGVGKIGARPGRGLRAAQGDDGGRGRPVAGAQPRRRGRRGRRGCLSRDVSRSRLAVRRAPGPQDPMDPGPGRPVL